MASATPRRPRQAGDAYGSRRARIPDVRCHRNCRHRAGERSWLAVGAGRVVGGNARVRLAWSSPRDAGGVVRRIVLVPLTVALGREGNLEGAFFLGVMMVLYVAWHLGSVIRAVVIAVAAAVLPWRCRSGWCPTPDRVDAVGGGQRVHVRPRAGAAAPAGPDRPARAGPGGAGRAGRGRGAAPHRPRAARPGRPHAGRRAPPRHRARHVLRRDVDEAERALVDAETVGRSSLDQIRATVAALRTDERGTDPALAGSADITALVDEYRRAGLDDHATAPGPPPSSTGRRARPCTASPGRRWPTWPATPRRTGRVTLDVVADEVHLLVADHGRPAAPPIRTRGTSGWSACGSGPGPSAGSWRPGRPPTAGGSRPACRCTAGGRRDPRRMIRVLIVDDQPVVRAGVARILGPEDGFEVVAECDDGDEVVAAVADDRPDVVLMDVRMRRVDGVTATRRLLEATDEPPVLVLTTFDDDDALWGALDAGAAGFVLKDASAEDLIAAARAVAGGAAWLDPKVAPGCCRRSGPTCGRVWPRRRGSTS